VTLTTFMPREPEMTAWEWLKWAVIEKPNPLLKVTLRPKPFFVTGIHPEVNSPQCE